MSFTPRTPLRTAQRLGAATLFAVAGVLAACTPGLSADPVTITVWTWDQPGAGLTAAIPSFEEMHPDIKVKVENVGNPAIWDKITIGMAAGGAGLADIMNIGVDYMGNYIERFPNGFANLSELGNADELESQFPATLWGSAQNADGDVFGIPYEVNTNVLFYRKDIFEQAGIDMDSIATWDQLLDAGITIKEKTGYYLFAMDKAASESDSANLWQILARLQGTFFFNKDGAIALSDAGSVAALDFIKRANDAGVIADIPGGWDNMMSQVKGDAKVATLASASWMAGVFPDNAPDLKGDWGVRRPPAMTEGGYTAASAGGTFLSIANSSPNKQQAWEFVKYALATLEGQELVYKGAGLFPSFRPMWKTEAFTGPNAYFNGEHVNELFIKALSEDTPPDYYTADYARALKAYTDAQTQVLLSGADPKQVLDAAAELLKQQTGRAIAN